VAVLTSMGLGVLIGHTALAILTPVALLALAWGYWRHRQPLALMFGTLAVGIAYLHVFGDTPEWTLMGVVGFSAIAAVVDWRAAQAAA
jgi:hypothetical protein